MLSNQRPCTHCHPVVAATVIQRTSAFLLRTIEMHAFSVVKRTVRELRMWLAALIVVTPSATHAQVGSAPPNLQDIVWTFAPIFIQETKLGDSPASGANDHLMPLDFDGNMSASDNRQNILNGYPIVDGRATIYYSFVETGTSSSNGYYYIGYWKYHPNDPGPSLFFGTISAGGHDSDTEGLVMAIKKDLYTYGSPQAVLTAAHGALIPYAPGQQPDNYNVMSAIGGGWQGLMQFWPDNRNTLNRFVAIMRSHTHGLYAAQDGGEGCGNYYTFDFGYGIDVGSAYYGPGFLICVHPGHSAIMYWPEIPESNTASSISRNANNGSALYRLVPMHTSPYWQLRDTYGALFVGSRTYLGFGLYGYDQMPSQTARYANPPWTQQGGAGQCVAGKCWYSFSVDNGINQAQSPKNWPTLQNGALLLDPDAAFATRVSGLVGIGLGTRYNPFLPGSPPPPCCTGNGPLTASIEGLSVVGSGNMATWSAIVSGGHYPYTYSWRVPLPSTESTTTGSICSDAALIVDVTDAYGAQVSASLVVQVSDFDPNEPQYPCMQ